VKRAEEWIIGRYGLGLIVIFQIISTLQGFLTGLAISP
jgi:hypothetical protein